MSNIKARAVNPFTGETISEHNYLTQQETQHKIQQSWDAFQRYRKTDVQSRATKLIKLAEALEKNTEKIARTIALEMGKPIKESRGEVQKAAKHARYYAEHLEEFSQVEKIDSKEAKKSYIAFQPLGPIFHVTPFNFPFWLIFKGVIPTIAMGNTVVNKNPSSCPQTGILAEEAFREAGYEEGVYTNLIVEPKQSEDIIKHPSIRGVSFTGSSQTGAEIASLAGKYCKKAVMELGGNDPFVVLKDADLDLAVEEGIKSRLRNGGQVCSSAKRFIVDESVLDEFKTKLVNKLSKVKMGDPLEEDTELGPQAKREGMLKLVEQINKAQQMGANVLLGGKQPQDGKLKKGFFFEPTVVEVQEGNILLQEEAFGPIFTLVKFSSEEDALRIANDTEYGLGGAIFSRDVEKAERMALEIETGFVFVNNMVSSGPEVPTGGVKTSGWGREGGKFGAHEFVNQKSVWIANRKY